MKAFKYFDLNNNGTVEPDEFAKAIEKIGIMIPTQQVRPVPFHLSIIRFLQLRLRWSLSLRSNFNFIYRT
jgi:EF-hand domain